MHASTFNQVTMRDCTSCTSNHATLHACTFNHASYITLDPLAAVEGGRHSLYEDDPALLAHAHADNTQYGTHAPVQFTRHLSSSDDNNQAVMTTINP